MIAAIEWSKGIEDAWSKTAVFAPKLIGAIVVFVVGIIIAKVIRAALRRLLKAIKVDQLAEKTAFGRSISKGSIGKPSELLVRILYIGLVLMAAQVAIGVFGPSPIATALNSMLAFIPKIAVALIIVMLTGWVVDKVAPIIRDLTAGKSYGPLVTKVAVGSLWLIGGFAALSQIEVARDIVDTLFKTIVTSLGAILVIKFGVGGIWAARDHFWPRVYGAVLSDNQRQNNDR